jgi:hypothetical protein
MKTTVPRLAVTLALLAATFATTACGGASRAAAEKLNGQARKDALTKLSQQLHTDARSAGDQPKAHKLAFSVGDLAK